MLTEPWDRVNWCWGSFPLPRPLSLVQGDPGRPGDRVGSALSLILLGTRGHGGLGMGAVQVPSARTTHAYREKPR